MNGERPGEVGPPGQAAPAEASGKLLLLGFMASGKSVVGRLLAARLGWRFEDVDARVEARAGSTIPELFRRRGEAAFRALEAEETAALLAAAERLVIATGGGWAAAEGRMESLSAEVRSIWLRVTPEEAVRRAGASPGARPLIEVEEPLARARALLRQREPYYRRADLTVDTAGRTPAEVAERILARLGEMG